MKTFVYNNKLVATVHIVPVLPPEKLLGLRVDNRTKQKPMVRRAERWPATLGERRVEEMAPLGAQLFAIRRTLQLRDARAALDKLAR